MRWLLGAVLAILALPAAAQHHGHGAAPAATPATAAFEAANARMHAAMSAPLSGNADRDFAASMIPHHQGAIDMARIELEHGKDESLRALAREIIAAQEKEIAFLKEWLARNPR